MACIPANDTRLLKTSRNARRLQEAVNDAGSKAAAESSQGRVYQPYRTDGIQLASTAGNQPLCLLQITDDTFLSC